jgi:hypothetical protein
MYSRMWYKEAAYSQQGLAAERALDFVLEQNGEQIAVHVRKQQLLVLKKV